ncbi:MAG: efflux RND transporter periplasmic adaptor subunit [Candidatus Omnitrophica bacterium]|nr:efflux RND transporter periplasmic adaptor subunit [Candidatus Omnitrophota bacterium]
MMIINKNPKRIFFILLISTILCIFSITGCAKKQAATAEKETAIPVKVMKVELKEIAESIEYVGNIKAQDEALIYPKVNGKIIEKIKEEGANIEKGEVIAYVDRDEVGFKFEKAPVESPLKGVIGEVFVDIGSQVSTQTPIALVVDMDRVEIDLEIPEKYIPMISLGQEAKIRVDAYPDEEFIGTITKISPVVDLATRTAATEIVIENPQHKLNSGMFAKISLVIRQHKGVPVILKEALVGKDPDLYVYITEGDKAVLRKVKVGIRQGPYYEVTEGLKEGDMVVIMGQQRLGDGVFVAPEE